MSSRPSPTPHELAMASRGLRAGHNKTPPDIRPEEPEAPEGEEADEVIERTPEVIDRTSEPSSDNKGGGYKTRDMRPDKDRADRADRKDKDSKPSEG